LYVVYYRFLTTIMIIRKITDMKPPVLEKAIARVNTYLVVIV
jgi:hypothetical protein